MIGKGELKTVFNKEFSTQLKLRRLLQLQIKHKYILYSIPPYCGSAQELPRPQSEGHWNVIDRIGIAHSALGDVNSFPRQSNIPLTVSRSTAHTFLPPSSSTCNAIRAIPRQLESMNQWRARAPPLECWNFLTTLIISFNLSPTRRSDGVVAIREQNCWTRRITSSYPRATEFFWKRMIHCHTIFVVVFTSNLFSWVFSMTRDRGWTYSLTKSFSCF